jgi:hypothetical protein
VDTGGERPKHVIVTAVVAGGRAEAAGLRVGMHVRRIWEGMEGTAVDACAAWAEGGVSFSRLLQIRPLVLSHLTTTASASVTSVPRSRDTARGVGGGGGDGGDGGVRYSNCAHRRIVRSQKHTPRAEDGWSRVKMAFKKQRDAYELRYLLVV